MENTYIGIIKEFYKVIAYLLKYECDEETIKIEKAILDLLCEIHCVQDKKEDIWRWIESARDLQLCTDENLLQMISVFNHTVAVSLKLEALQTHRIDRLKSFHPVLFSNDIQEGADLGDHYACKLWAYLSWLGIVLPENKQKALKLWAMLATNGDRESISMLCFAYDEVGRLQEADKWRNILNILNEEYESFSSVALSSKYKDFSAEEVQFANLIMLIKQKNANRRSEFMDRPMLCYVLESEADMEYKMECISSDANYYSLMKLEDRYSGKKFGF
jgi:hypothetical protein